MIANYHGELFAHELLQRYPSDSVERFAAILMDSHVGLNPPPGRCGFVCVSIPPLLQRGGIG